METDIDYLIDITYQSKLILDIKDVKDLIRTITYVGVNQNTLLHKVCAH